MKINHIRTGNKIKGKWEKSQLEYQFLGEDMYG